MDFCGWLACGNLGPGCYLRLKSGVLRMRPLIFEIEKGDQGNILVILGIQDYH